MKGWEIEADAEIVHNLKDRQAAGSSLSHLLIILIANDSLSKMSKHVLIAFESKLLI